MLPARTLHREVVQTLLYYDIWHYPLNAREIFAFLPVNSISFAEFKEHIHRMTEERSILEKEGFYFIPGRSAGIVELRRKRERHARRLWRMARLSMHVIKRFPFVRGVFVSGDLSKNATTPKSDVDFFIVTEPGRLWITRTLLILFKKTFLLNSKKFFCLNYFASMDHLELDEQNIFLATEVAQIKPLYNERLFRSYLQANSWIKHYFPNFDPALLPAERTDEKQSLLQGIFEFPFRLLPAEQLDRWLQQKMEVVWKKRYPQFDDVTRQRIFRCSRHESRAYVGDFQTRILALYSQRLREFGVND